MRHAGLYNIVILSNKRTASKKFHFRHFATFNSYQEFFSFRIGNMPLFKKTDCVTYARVIVELKTGITSNIVPLNREIIHFRVMGCVCALCVCVPL